MSWVYLNRKELNTLGYNVEGLAFGIVVTTISWVRAKVSFAILRNTLLCLRGSRTPRRRNLDVKNRDLEIEKGRAGLP